MSCDIILSKVCSTEAIAVIAAYVTMCNWECLWQVERWKGGPASQDAGWLAGWRADWLTDWLECVFWDLVSILFKMRPRPQTSRKPFIMLYREGNMGKNRADHVAPSLSPSPDLPSSLLLLSICPGNTQWHTQTAPTPVGLQSLAVCEGLF